MAEYASKGVAGSGLNGCTRDRSLLFGPPYRMQENIPISGEKAVTILFCSPDCLSEKIIAWVFLFLSAIIVLILLY